MAKIAKLKNRVLTNLGFNEFGERPPVSNDFQWNDLSESVGKPYFGATNRKIFAQTTAPTIIDGYSEDDIWFDTDDNNHPYRANSSLTWVSIRDSGSAPAGSSGFIQSMVYTATDHDTLSWSSGAIVRINGATTTTYTIDAGNTGNVSAITYIFLDTDVSTTVLQTTTTPASAVGANRILLAVCRNVASGKLIEFQAFAGMGQGTLIVADNIAANTITANEIATGTITTGNLNFTPVQDTNVIASINASAEGIDITADRIAISGSTSFSAGYDPTIRLLATGGAYATAASGARVLIFPDSNTGFQAIDDASNNVFKILVGGADVGDVIFGDTAQEYIKYDKSANKFVYVLPDLSNQFPSDANLVGNWAFDEGTGTQALDTSISANHGTLNNMEAGDWVVGPAGKALAFGGTNENITIGNVSELNFERTDDFSYSFWANHASAVDGIALAKMEASVNYRGWGIYFTGATIFIDFINTWSTNVLRLSIDNTWDDSAWHHFVVTYDGTSTPTGVKFYVDGVLQTLTTVYNTLSATMQNTISFNIASRDSAAYFVGSLSSIKIYNSVLTSSNVKALYKYPNGNSLAIPPAIAGINLQDSANVILSDNHVKNINNYTAGESISMGDIVCQKNSYASDFTATHDSYVNDTAGSEDTNYGTATTLFIDLTANEFKHFYMKFDESNIPDDCQVAYLDLYIYQFNGSTDITLTIQEVSADWDESTITWNNKPAVEAQEEDEVVVHSSDLATYVRFNITRLARYWQEGNPNYGIRVIGSGSGTWLSIASSEAVSNKPYMRCINNSASDGKVYKAVDYVSSGDDGGINLSRNVVGVAIEAKTTDETIRIFDADGQVRGTSITNGDAGKIAYLNTTAGGIVTDPVNLTHLVPIGYGTASGNLKLRPEKPLYLEKWPPKDTCATNFYGETSFKLMPPKDAMRCVLYFFAADTNGYNIGEGTLIINRVGKTSDHVIYYAHPDADPVLEASWSNDTITVTIDDSGWLGSTVNGYPELRAYYYSR